MRKFATGKGIGHFNCPNPVHKTPSVGVIRQKNNERRTLYGFCGTCGMMDWNLEDGQEFFRAHGTIWPKPDHVTPVPPADLPAWIREGRAWAPRPGRKLEDGPAPGQPVDTTVRPEVIEVPPAEPATVPVDAPGKASDVPETVPESQSEKPAKKAGILDGWF